MFVFISDGLRKDSQSSLHFFASGQIPDKNMFVFHKYLPKIDMVDVLKHDKKYKYSSGSFGSL